MHIIAWLLPHGSIAAALLALSLAACQPLSGGFDTAAGGPARTAELAKMRNPAATTTTVPPVLVPNPFACPRRATP